VDETGGAVQAIEEGFMQRAIADSSYDYQKKVESKDQIVVGLNKFQIDEKLAYDILKVSPEVERESVERIRAVRERRSADKARDALAAVESCARGSDNLMPAILGAVRAECTTGEIADTLRGVFGEYQERTG
jgi:methylmalonyl-CoA mutase N-terminal domain/subunit